MCNLYTIDAIEKISKEPLIYHTAFKKNSYIDENGKEVIPTEPNSYKFESFIFDVFEFFDDIAIMRGKREDDFAPVKNKEDMNLTLCMAHQIKLISVMVTKTMNYMKDILL